ncbi:SDR family oxidoreductase [Cellulomonas chengniuliangii]|uniref:SDR family oxidoreductase n=1 Tax=Cellulomonas chengniuliangii TaxID=2968084 RepID=UPI001D0ED04C|nr:SDR family oxidoreductase [Cellulomonas chengniuliangii]MCC2307464.1 SDR family oxidoreductase [Cellulomonas chengniuliangii]MCC2317961.1 SDR family oxidoreductase [Cellulomonas chengniuliangii]
MSNAFDLTGKTAAVTGGGRGLGLGISQALLEAGADVIVFGRSGIPDELTALAGRLGREVAFYALDLADSDQIAEVGARVLAEHRVDVLVNNAGTQDRYPAAEFPLEAWDRVIDVNLRSVFQLCQIFGRPMLERGEGKIVNLASLLSFQGGLTVPAYAASKGGVAQLTKALCNEWSGKGVNVNAVAPGYMATEMNTALLNDPVRLEQLSVRIPAGRWGQPEDIGNVVVFLASQASAYVHGQVLAVDGGWMAR